jgi:hypothetical protein
VPKASADAYWSSGRAKRCVAPAAIADNPTVDTEPTLRLVEPDKAAAKSHGTDLNVFGIPLGGPLTLSECPQGSYDDMVLEVFNVTTVASSCIVKKASTLTQLFAQLGAAGSSVPWVSSGLSIKLGRSSCPDWVTSGCMVVLNVQNGIPLGAFFTTAGVEQERKIEGLLVPRYPYRNKPAMWRGRSFELRGHLSVLKERPEHTIAAAGHRSPGRRGRRIRRRECPWGRELLTSLAGVAPIRRA